MAISTKHIDAISRADLWSQEIYTPNQGDIDTPIISDILMYRVRAISVLWDAPETWLESWRLLATDTATGFHGAGTAMYFAILGSTQGIEVLIGIEAPGSKTDPVQALLTSAYPGTELEKLNGDQLEQVRKSIEQLKYQATVVGSPVVKVGSEGVGVEQLERVIRGMYGKNWALVVVAKPVSTQKTGVLLQTVINELRMVCDFETSSGADKPLVKEYESGLDALQKKLLGGQGSGVWNAGVNIFCNDLVTLKTAKALIKGVLGGEKSYPDPIQAIEIDRSKFTFPAFGFINEPAPQGPGKFQYEYRFASLVNSEELSAFARLPLEEQPGFHVFRSASFDVFPHNDPQEKDSIVLGNIVDRQADTGIPYRISINDLNRHALVVGNTGSGKTNTVFKILKDIGSRIPFLVLEPAKREYRSLQSSYPDLKIYTAGDFTGSPLCINPFEVTPGVPVLTQIDNIKALFNAAFMLWAPLPYVLERCIQEIYQDRGWNLLTNTNHRGEHPLANPTLTDLYEKVDSVAIRLGYEDRVTANIRAALQTRINSLRSGGKGKMLDVRQSISTEDLLNQPSIVEIERIGDDEEKAFVVGLLLLKIYHYYLSLGIREKSGLCHLTVIEEAHRLLANVPRNIDPEIANARGKAVETFCNMLAEMRAYGEGFLVAEQIPTKVAPELIKNTSLKVMHRVGALDDLQVMAASMNMDDRQIHQVASLPALQAAVFGLDDDRPMLVRVPYVKEPLKSTTIKTQINSRKTPSDTTRFQQWAVIEWSNPRLRWKIGAQVMAFLAGSLDYKAFQEETTKLVASLYFGGGQEAWSELMRLGIVRTIDVLGGIFDRPFTKIQNLEDLSLKVIFLENETSKNIKSLQSAYTEFCHLHHYPYTGCEIVCPDQACFWGSLLYEQARKKEILSALRSAGTVKDGNLRWEEMAKISRRVVDNCLPQEIDHNAIIQSGTCAVVQAIDEMVDLNEEGRQKITRNVNKALSFTFRS